MAFTGNPVEKLMQKKRGKQPLISSLWYLHLFKKENKEIFHLIMATSVFHSDENQVGGLHFSTLHLSLKLCTHTTYAVNGVFANRQLDSSVRRYRVKRRRVRV